MILTPLINIDNLNLSKIKPLWSLMTKEEKQFIKDRGTKDIGEKYESKGIN
jgi:hypothetical protein